MSKLDNIKPSHPSGFYKVELNVEGEWVALAALSRKSIECIADLMMELCDEDLEPEQSNKHREDV